ncbi:nucleotidyltransferase domain-containing protein [Planomicrobium sp. Y74]|uniref:nucleotidyltransferase domain-containing protein n=1 Tax=Planomicrobium sp. Y74 TaxID=2478977 RepID=UPI000EF480A1|nr:nucleotidyltransferase domain-containing protein [Planomicrobium sp. Y74]RLQ83889.1 nucleotidyltransferase domain-containing protein [Planomicrobium sp. Y74]
MLQQELAVEKICTSLKKDNLVKAIFLKGSMGRDERDEFSDIDLYCLVEKENEELFLNKRLEHIKAYREIIFYDDIYIIAPQIIVVFDNLLHLDLFTVTEQNFTEKDYFKVLHDPNNLLEQFNESQSLEVSESEFSDSATDIAWFLFQYKKAIERGNDIWAVRMLTNVMEHLARVLLYKYCPERAQLGLKTLNQSLPNHILNEVEAIFEQITPRNHATASSKIRQLLAKEYEWILSQVSDRSLVEALLKEMVKSQSISKR